MNQIMKNLRLKNKENDLKVSTFISFYKYIYQFLQVFIVYSSFTETSESSVFGMSLNDLFIKDKKQDKNCVIPFVLEIVTKTS